MKNLLLVDDEEPFLLSVTDGLKSYSKDLNIFLARNGKEALYFLQNERIDLLLTDLKMPVMDGFELLARMSREFPLVPVLVMTAYGTPETEERLQEFGVLPYLEKPLDLNVLAERVFGVLDSGSRGYIQGISLSSFLQLVEMERKTCSIGIRAAGKEGYLYFRNGELVDAVAGELVGEPAAFDIVTWDGVEMDILTECKRKQKTVRQPLRFILMEAFRIRDEEARGDEGAGGGEKAAEPGSAGPDGKAAGTSPQAPPSKSVGPDAILARLREFKALPGFAGAGIYNPAGEVLAWLPGGVDLLGTVGGLANRVLLIVQKAIQVEVAGDCSLVEFEIEGVQVLAACLNEGTDPDAVLPGTAHVHLVLVQAGEDSGGSAREKVKTLLPQIATQFRAK